MQMVRYSLSWSTVTRVRVRVRARVCVTVRSFQDLFKRWVHITELLSHPNPRT
jgi:hypothetical protein